VAPVSLYLARHAEAVPVGGSIARDADRPLSAKGESDAAAMAQVISRLDRKIAVVLTSPLVRAMRTGEIFCRALGGGVERRVSENLAPGFRHKELLSELRALSTDGAVVAVGHQPDLGNFLCFLIAGSSRAEIAMAASAVAKVTFNHADEDVTATLRWLLTPETVRGTFPRE